MSRYTKRPKIKIPRTKSEWIWDIIGFSVFLGIIIFLIVVWKRLPDEVPAHYNAAGEVDRWGSKWELTILPLTSFFTVMLLQGFELYPETHNYPKRFNETNAKQFYLNSRQMLNQLKNMILIVFSLILYESVAIALEWSDGFGFLFLPIVLILAFTPLIFGLIRRHKIR